MKSIEFIETKSGDWQVLLVDGAVYDHGHSFPNITWLNLLSELGCKVECKTISDAEMQEGY